MSWAVTLQHTQCCTTQPATSSSHRIQHARLAAPGHRTLLPAAWCILIQNGQQSLVGTDRAAAHRCQAHGTSLSPQACAPALLCLAGLQTLPPVPLFALPLLQPAQASKIRLGQLRVCMCCVGSQSDHTGPSWSGQHPPRSQGHRHLCHRWCSRPRCRGAGHGGDSTPLPARAGAGAYSCCVIRGRQCVTAPGQQSHALLESLLQVKVPAEREPEPTAPAPPSCAYAPQQLQPCAGPPPLS